MSLLFIPILLLGILTYIILRQTIGQLVTVPLWLLWSVLMTPPVLTGITVVWGKQIPPLPIAIVVSLISWSIYWRLLDRDRRKPQQKEVDQADHLTQIAPVIEPKPTEPPLPIRPIDSAEEATLRTCFAWNVFFLEKIEYRPQAVLCRGKLRTDADGAFTTVKQNIERLFGDRFFVLFQYSLSTGKPFFALVPYSPPPKVTAFGWWCERTIGLISLILTLIATTYVGALLIHPRTTQLDQIIQTGLPYGLSIIASLAIRDFGRYLVAQYYQIESNFPYSIPLPFFPGTFGSIVQLKSPIPNRKAVFDLGFTSSILGLAIAIPILFWGLSQSQIVSIDPKATLFSFHALNPRFSMLFSLLCKLALGSELGPEQAIDLHNVAIAAYISLLIITINLMPLRRLDGGHIVHAMFGQKPSTIVSQCSKILLLILGFIRFKASGFGNTDLLFLAIAISLIPAIDEPALNDVSELDRWRDTLGVLMLAITALILMPVPNVLLGILGL